MLQYCAYINVNIVNRDNLLWQSHKRFSCCCSVLKTVLVPLKYIPVWVYGCLVPFTGIFLTHNTILTGSGQNKTFTAFKLVFLFLLLDIPSSYRGHVSDLMSEKLPTKPPIFTTNSSLVLSCLNQRIRIIF